jgi:3-oxoacyl-[acyl-carrier protein] reductase
MVFRSSADDPHEIGTRNRSSPAAVPEVIGQVPGERFVFCRVYAILSLISPPEKYSNGDSRLSWNVEREESMDLGLKDRVAIVAASSLGLGKACALELAHEGARVVICARDASLLTATASEIRESTGADVLALATDLTDPEQIQHLASETLRRFSRIDVLVTNNGGPPAGYFQDQSDEAWLAAHQLTLMSAVRLIRAVLPAMRAQGWGRIVNITSVSVKQPIDDLLFSNVYRPGVVGLAKTLSTQLASEGITINNVAPGYTRTERVVELFESRAAQKGTDVEQEIETLTADFPIKRMGKPEETAALVAFLASERASYITGATIQVDGGYVRSIM